MGLGGVDVDYLTLYCVSVSVSLVTACLLSPFVRVRVRAFRVCVCDCLLCYVLLC